MEVSVERYLRKKFPKEENSPVLYYIRQKVGDVKTVGINEFCANIESGSSLKKGEVRHVLEEFVDQLREALTRGDKVRIEGMGTFHISLRSKGEVKKKDSTVRSINRVFVRFTSDKALHLVNSAYALTESNNNISFALSTPKEEGGDGKPDDQDPIPDPKDDGKPDPKDDGKGDDDDDNIPDPLS